MKYLKSFKFWILFIVLSYTALGFAFIPWFLTNKTSPLLKEKIGINIDIGKAKFNPYTFDLSIEDILLKDLNQKPVLGFKKLRIDYVLLGLLDKTVLFRELDMDSPIIYTSLNKKGEINLQNIMPPSKNEEKSEKKQSFEIPTIILKKLNITNGYLNFSDFRGEKPFDLKLGSFDFKAYDISTKEGDLNAHSFKTKINEDGEIFWEGGMRINPLSLYGEVNITNLRLPKLYSYVLGDYDALLKSGTLNLLIPYQIDLSKDFQATVNDAKLTLSNINIIDKKSDTTAIDVPQINLSGFNLKWPEQSVSINKIEVNDPSVLTVLDKQKNLNLLKLFEPKNKKAIEVKKEEKSSSKPWTYVLNDANINKANISFTDNSLEQSVKSQLSDLSLHVNNISSNTQSPINYEFSSLLNTKTDIKLSGDMVQKSQKLHTKLELTSLHVRDFVNYIKPFVNFDIKGASVDVKADLSADFSKNNDIKIQADTIVNNLDIDGSNGEKLFKWKRLDINGIKYTHEPLSIYIKDMKLQEPYARAHISKDRSTNFSNIVKKTDTPKKVEKKEAKTKTRLNLKIGPMKLVNGTIDFSDLSLPFPFKTHINDLQGDVSTFDFETTTPTKLALTGKIDNYGYADIKGDLLPFAIKDNASIDVLFKNIDLNSLTPYSGKFVGYKIQSGKLSMDLKYNISKASLIGSNKINIDTLTLGDTVESPDAVSLPLELAIALLKDSNGQIDIDLPVTGDMNNPKFSYGGVIWGAIGNMITGIVTAPFRFLGSMLGIDGDELKSIDFDKGSYLVISTEHEKLNNLQKILEKRPAIKLSITPGYDSMFDVAQLQNQEFDVTIKTELPKTKVDANSTKEDIYGIALKNLYTKEFTQAKYMQLKNTFTTVVKNNDKNATKAKPKPTLDVIGLNKKMQNELTLNIKISKEKLENLANKRADSLKSELVKTYKIDAKRIKVLAPKTKEAKQDRWIETDIDISI